MGYNLMYIGIKRLCLIMLGQTLPLALKGGGNTHVSAISLARG